ncbi:MAG: DUF695 domain-containing protein [Anaeromyxobacter sp.]|nr:DUF695 domain-containing protein [Anaeromyxobacter sp.]MBL0275466.1 DUF695 domain-containing protein [Anaeromyxobacter sp.]
MRWLKNLFSRSESAATAEAPAGPASSMTSGPAPGAEPVDWVSHQRASQAGPVAIAVDLSLAGRAPLGDHPRLVRIRCALRAPRADGLPEPAEAEALVRVEDLLVAALSPAGAVYAGRVTTAGVRQHLFYLPEAAGVEAELGAVRDALAEYDLGAAGEDDPAWEAYRLELFPTPRAHRWLLDRRAVEALARRGDRGAAPRPVDHQASFPSSEAREAFVTEATASGFEVVARRDDGPPPSGFAVDLRRADPLALQHIHGVAWALAEQATRHGGSYDGWEAEASPTSP